MKKFFMWKSSILEESIDRVLREMNNEDLDTEDYDILLTKLERLMRLQETEKSNRISPDTMAIVGANLLGILIIVGYEHGHVVASRGLQLLLRTKHQ